MLMYLSRALVIFSFMVSALYAQSSLSQRRFSIANETDLSFYLLPKPFEGAEFSSFNPTILPGQTIHTTLSTFDGIRNANGVLAFHLDNHYVFSLVVKDALVSVHGCKSKPVFFHPEEYVCALDDLPTGEKRLLIQRPGQ